MIFQAVTKLGPVDIGEFENSEQAEEWARLRYGEDFEGVLPIQQLETSASTIDPLKIALLIMLVLFLLKRR
jgi:hypothetical protein